MTEQRQATAEPLPTELRGLVGELTTLLMTADDPVRAAHEFAHLLAEWLNGASGVER
ncbi:hypothetical protein [Streptomyces sp. bgisy034]|uniref:hypothetical protein n=1 Tax=Streptomyces sp. bgisy034 TaxID=3413774 RepID=UPI003EB93785